MEPGKSTCLGYRERGQATTSGVIPSDAIHFVYFREVLSLAWSSSSRLGWPQGCACLHLSSVSFQAHATTPYFYQGLWGPNSRPPSYLSGKALYQLSYLPSVSKASFKSSHFFSLEKKIAIIWISCKTFQS